jgi:hypothetical protein
MFIIGYLLMMAQAIKICHYCSTAHPVYHNSLDSCDTFIQVSTGINVTLKSVFSMNKLCVLNVT